MTKILHAAAIGLALGALASPVFAEDKDPVVARANGQEIHASEVSALGNGGMMPPPVMQPAQTLPPGMYQQFLEQAIITKLLAKAGYDEGVQNDRSVKERLQASDDRIIADAYVDHAADQKVTDDKIKERYKDMVDKFVAADQVKVSMIQVPTEDEAKDVIKQLKKGADFNKLAMEKSKDPMSARGGDYGYMPANALLPPFADGIKGLKKGDFSEEPFKSNFGFSVFKLDDQRKSSPPPLEELKGQIAAQLRHEIADDVRRQVEAKAKIERFNADGTPIIMAAPPAPPQQPAPSPPVPAPQAQPPVPPANIAPPAKK